MEQAKGFFKKVIETIKKPEMRILPGQLAFFLVMSLIPLAALLGAIAASFQISVETLQKAMEGAIPTGVINFIGEIMANKMPNFNIIIFFISAFILASNGPHSMIITSNEIYKIESRNFISRRIKAIMMTFIMAGLFFIIFLIPVFGDRIFKIISLNIANERLINFLQVSYEIIKYPLLILIIYFNIRTLYTIAPDEKIKSVTVTQGALFTTICWIISSEIYSLYIGTFTSYDKFYGSISNIVILLLWIYIMAYIFVIGMIINAGTYRENTEVLKVVNEE